MTKLIRLFVLAISMVGCSVNVPRASDTRTCDDVAIVLLQGMLTQQMTPANMRDRLVETYKVPSDQAQYVISNDNGASVSVHKGGIKYSVEMQGNDPVGARIQFDTLPMSAGKAISCIGEPDLYRARYAFGPSATDHLLSLNLFIPRQGVEIYAFTFGTSKFPPKLTEDIPVAFLSVVIPSDHESTMAALLRDSPADSEYGQQLRRQLKPWPGNWQDIQIEIDPALQ